MELKLKRVGFDPYNQEERFLDRGMARFSLAHDNIDILKRLNDKDVTDEEFKDIVRKFYAMVVPETEEKPSREEVISENVDVSEIKGVLTPERVTMDILEYIEMLRGMGEKIQGVLATERGRIEQELTVLNTYDGSLNGILSSLGSR